MTGNHDHTSKNWVRATHGPQIYPILFYSGMYMTSLPDHSGKSISNSTVLTCGTFDLLHIGHLNQLMQAKQLGDRLVVGVSSDYLNLKKKGRIPMVPLYQRIRLIQSLRCVDDVFVEEEYDCKSKEIYSGYHGADTFSIGDDWKGKFDSLINKGGITRVVYLPRTPNMSTTQTIEVGKKNMETRLLGEEFRHFWEGLPIPEKDSLKPNLECTGLLPQRVLVTVHPGKLLHILPWMRMFCSDRIFWHEDLVTSPEFSDFDCSRIGSRSGANAGPVDLIMTDRYDPQINVEQWAIQPDGDGMSYKLKLDGSEHFQSAVGDTSINASLIKPCRWLWFLNQRLNESTVDRSNTLITLDPKHLAEAKSDVVRMSHTSNLIVAPHKDEQVISVPGSTLNYIFWQSLNQNTAQFVNILPTNFYIHVPNLYVHCDRLITDRSNKLAELFIPQVELYTSGSPAVGKG